MNHIVASVCEYNSLEPNGFGTEKTRVYLAAVPRALEYLILDDKLHQIYDVGYLSINPKNPEDPSIRLIVSRIPVHTRAGADLDDNLGTPDYVQGIESIREVCVKGRAGKLSYMAGIQEIEDILEHFPPVQTAMRPGLVPDPTD